ncbi:MAG: hypothetical protein MI784_15670 [Cytophagales bacterium]|nr:hypothetical protein [Cytophagales bacterium]
MKTNNNPLSIKKEELQILTGQYKDALIADVKEFREKSEKIGRKALAIGSVLAAGYILSILLRPSSKKKSKSAFAENSKKPARTSLSDEIGRVIMKQIALFLLGIARRKLTFLLNRHMPFLWDTPPSVNANEPAQPINKSF